MALQNSILIWSSQHRTHHRFVDDVDKDPYSAKRGFWFSHMGWILRNYPSGENDFTNAKDLERDPIVMFQHRFYLPLTHGDEHRPAARTGLGRRRRLGRLPAGWPAAPGA
jgi:stearoyl-CoA desaturase (Delta-9 desaturase)